MIDGNNGKPHHEASSNGDNLYGSPMGAKIVTGTATKPEQAVNMISPNHDFMKRWDLFMILLLSYVSIVTPYEVAFLKTKIDFLFFLNRIVDGGFIIDMRVQFMLPIYLSNENVYIWDKGIVTKKYLSFWFIIDTISIIPYDIFEFLGASGASSLKILRTVRLLRLVKLARVLKAAKIFDRIQNYFELTFIITYMIQMAIGCLVIVHWFACIWGKYYEATLVVIKMRKKKIYRNIVLTFYS
jgi:hypothetical protein